MLNVIRDANYRAIQKDQTVLPPKHHYYYLINIFLSQGNTDYG
jgi:hypothetical protein